MVRNKEKITDPICQAIEIIGRQLMSEMSFDITETATIVDNSKKDQGQYIVRSSTGTAEYTAYSTDTNLSKNTAVYVTIPKGDYNEQKLIVSKKTSETEKPIVVKNSIDDLIELVGTTDFFDGEFEKSYSLLANNNIFSKQILPQTQLKQPLSGYTRFGIRADFRSWIPEAVSGDYGLVIHLYSELLDETVDEEDIEIINDKKYVNNYIYLNTEQMFGNPYNFQGYFPQDYMVDISGLGTIDYISIEFRQEGNFVDKNGESLPTTQTSNGIEESLPDNLFVSNIQLSMGLDKSEITDGQYINLYTLNSDKYTGNTANIKEDNKKVIRLRWVKDNEVIDSIDENTRIEWFRYKMGAASATTYSGVEWEKLNNDNQFSLDFYPDVNLQSEKLKVIITETIGENKNHYRSNILEFTNGQDVSGINAGKYMSALTIRCDDNSYGNYFIYDQGYGLLDQSQSKEIKTITAHFDLDKTGDKIDSPLLEADSIAWTIPDTNTMINTVDIEGIPYNSLNENRGQYVKTEDIGDYFRIEYSDNKYENIVLKIKYIKAEGNEDIIGEEWFKENKSTDSEGQLITTDVSFRTLTINSDGSAVGKEIIGNYIKIINFSKYGYKDNELVASQPKYTIYNKLDGNNYDVLKPLRIYDKINNFITICNYKKEKTNDDIIINNKLQYRINGTYSPSYNNNTIQCKIMKDGVNYTTSKELSFGLAGTADTDYTLVLDFDDNKHALTIEDNTATSLTLRLYGQDGKEIINFTEDKNVTWSLYSGSFGIDINFMTGTPVKDNNKIISYTAKQFMEIKQGSSTDSNSIIIVQASINWADRELIAYLPIPITDNPNWNYIKGATRLNYLSDGSIDYDKQSYEVFTTEKEKIKITNREIINNKVDNADKYAPTIDTNTQGIKPINIYIDPEKARYAVKLSDGTNYWTNPILILQNRYPSAGINNWDGEELKLDVDNSSIYSSFIAAGKKNSQGQFSGVILGEAKEPIENSMRQTGLYGFQDGEMSYAFKEDGTAFIGKSGGGRIEFKGTSGIIQSGNYDSDSGMKIDLDDGIIEIKGKGKSIELNGSTGELTAEGASISGTINATSGTFSEVLINSGTIGGWTIEADQLSGINGTISGGKIVGSTISFSADNENSGIFITHPNNKDTLLKFAYEPIKYLEDGKIAPERMYFGQVEGYQVPLKFKFSSIDFSDCDEIKGLGVVPVFGE